MQRNNHTKFILTPIAGVLKDSVNACKGISDSIETQPLSEYIYQTTFLKMTGASEQKLKCICWEIATFDYDYRYQMLSKPLGECSSFEDKKNVFRDILKAIINLHPSYDFGALFTKEMKQELIENVRRNIISVIEGTILSTWEARSFLQFKSNPIVINKEIDHKSFANNTLDNKAKMPCSFLENDLMEYYKTVVYRHRNRCAHNLRSYQNNLPTLKTLMSKNYECGHYFNIFFVLILMDVLYMTLYKEYLSILKSI